MVTTVSSWVDGCRDCGSRKVRAPQVVPPLRSLGAGAVGDRWALDVAGPLPTTAADNSYVIAAVEYVSKFVVAEPVRQHTAPDVARFLVDRVIFTHGPFRELITDGASETVGSVMSSLVQYMQARQPNPVPYRPVLMGAIERFNRTWKEMVSLYSNERQNAWAYGYVHLSTLTSRLGTQRRNKSRLSS